ncbi:hypothetical protein A2U01_0097173, partial [Trifolium medium]|nr:hypothetical protein [Trifolium medium]
MFRRVIVNENGGEDVGRDCGVNPLQDHCVKSLPKSEIVGFGLLICGFLFFIRRRD